MGGEIIVRSRKGRIKIRRKHTFELDVAVDEADRVHPCNGATEYPADREFGKG